MTTDAYTREELLRAGEATFPERGPLCPRCGTRVPQFAELPEDAERRVLAHIHEGRLDLAVAELRRATGAPERWAKIWVQHEGKPMPHAYDGPPCPYCGEALRSASARQCLRCGMDWHDAAHPRKLGSVPL